MTDPTMTEGPSPAPMQHPAVPVPTPSGRPVDPDWVHDAVERLEGASPETVLRVALDSFAPRVALACSFGAEDMCLVDMLARLDPSVPMFYLDTAFLFPETYATLARAEAHYGVRFTRYASPLSPEKQAAAYGDRLWARDPDACCAIRKVEPLRHALAGLDAWITGIRRDQTPARATARVVEWDSRHGLVKFNPLATWTWRDVWSYIHAHDVPYNPLHDRGYPSIGCFHCTRPVAPGEDLRAGRWAGLNKTECGLHFDT